MRPLSRCIPVSAGGTAALLAATLFLAGCKGVPTEGERTARENLRTIGEAYRPQNLRPTLPTLQTNAGLSNFLHFAVLNQPQVESAYF